MTRLRFLPPLLVAVFATLQLYRSPWSASNLEVVPDAVEYAIGAHRLATLHRYDIELNGIAYPTHYWPWFPALLAPVYAVAPGEIGNGIVTVLAFAVVAVLAAYAIGDRLSGAWGGAAAAVALTQCRLFAGHARFVLTDVPAVALALVGCVLFLRMRERAWRRDWLLAGAVAALAGALRGVAIVIAVPFLFLALRRRRPIRDLATLLAPTALLAVATAAYNHATFGDWRRSGYQFWWPVPCDYPNLLFSIDYLGGNLRSLASGRAVAAAALGAAGVAALLARRATALRPVLAYSAVVAGGVTATHLVYFYPSLRFHLLAISVLYVLAGAGIAALLPRAIARRTGVLAALLALALLAPRPRDPAPQRRLVAAAIARATPPDAVVVSGIEPVYLEYFIARGTQRRVVPASRAVEYASKAIAPRRVARPDPPPHGATDHRAEGLLRGGARDVVPFTADEAGDAIAGWVRSGVPVYLDASFLPPGFSYESVLGSALGLEPFAAHPWLARLAVRR
jgi:hypothetical protein